MNTRTILERRPTSNHVFYTFLHHRFRAEFKSTCLTGVESAFSRTEQRTGNPTWERRPKMDAHRVSILKFFSHSKTILFTELNRLSEHTCKLLPQKSHLMSYNLF